MPQGPVRAHGRTPLTGPSPVQEAPRHTDRRGTGPGRACGNRARPGLWRVRGAPPVTGPGYRVPATRKVIPAARSRFVSASPIATAVVT